MAEKTGQAADVPPERPVLLFTITEKLLELGLSGSRRRITGDVHLLWVKAVSRYVWETTTLKVCESAEILFGRWGDVVI